MELTGEALTVFGSLLEARTGQQLLQGRSWRLDTTLKAILKDNGFHDVEALARHLGRTRDPALEEAVAFALLNHETFFFRDAATFTALIQRGLPQLAAARNGCHRLKIWSAGCSTGQEPYSLAMAFLRDPAWQDWSIDIVATDISPMAIDRAMAATYSPFEAQRGLSVHEMLEMFEPVGEEWRIVEALRRRVRFQRHSLLDAPPHGIFDIVLCRNVLLYFPLERRSDVLERIARAMAPDGLLMLGAGETLMGQTDAFLIDPEMRGIYRRRPVGEMRLDAVA